MKNTLSFLVCLVGIYISYLSLSLVQEHLTKMTFGSNKVKFRNTAFILFWQCAVDVIGARLTIKLLGGHADHTPIIQYSFVAVSYLGAMFSSSLALQYVSFPVAILAKSCKPIPVMLMGVLISGTKQPLTKYICVFLITSGISIYFFNEPGSEKGKGAEDSTFGFILLGISLALDGFTGPLQERVISKYSPTPKHMMLYTNAWACVFLTVVLLFTGQGMEGIKFCIEYPSVITYIFLLSVTSAVGQTFIYLTIFKFGSLACSIITTTRKFFTILISVLLFGNPVSFNQWIGVFTVFAGLTVDILGSSFKSKKAKKTE
eukprot:TRINITY_DN4029_c0_g1_i1.p1 TRINITY_DN4029_c0_g1~~TRINITY_DN4029_c0_g1_i1.p1  ORF type:complete len:317 (-),score=57.47 TRINITY_DN4029_c0_g1_i1:40-990(-)